ncbi:IS4 family transposase [Chitinophaga sp. Mgbs1]|uniref:IS4 family transposase n=1 Tax=Chitinophaga solisilvae TaxID=1233460 RepID=A0A9Q5D7C1_9BACT|nr:IS4 family transposase [Chitinophaga solisilvae]NSL85846.1 IS4 family transposase [Chitinophaga solisilvae]NSL86388.1 IS4 family transposase [Chitinophaga solisilvae]NSL86853.1 IS4 family transposase [Chitinophaga solisilvae]NSL88901.1 IS4 family transposase [Chitinophaga solisilvae]
MNKGTYFTGQPIFSQLLSFVPRSLVTRMARTYNSDRYCKRFKTYDHLITLLYSIINQCSSLREVTTGMLAWEQRLIHLGIAHPPRRSTISDAGARRGTKVFEGIYLELLKRYDNFLPDSRISKRQSKLYLFDSTTITLFQDILKGAGKSSADGKRKGGIKVHTLVRSDQDVPCMIRFSSAAGADVSFLKKVVLPPGSIIVFDKGYRDYSTYNLLNEKKITWITRNSDTSIYKIITHYPINEYQVKKGVLADRQVELGHNHNKKAIKVNARIITYKDKESGATFEFLTNNLSLAAATIADCYHKRWQIELLFKRLKQNYQLKYFLGDSPNAIKIQIWCTLIADLILKVIANNYKCKWAFTNLVGMVRLHMMTYLNLKSFIASPEKTLLQRFYHYKLKYIPPSLFAT